MSDIVERLRTTGDPWPQYADVPLCVEAAAEIARLRAQVDGLTKWRENLWRDKEHADAENERLRAALQEMSECSEHPCAFCFEMAQKARRALEGGQ